MTFLRAIKLSWLLFACFFISIFLYFKAVEYNFLYLFGSMPSIAVLENPKVPAASELYTSDSVLIGRYYRENHAPTTYEKLSPYLINALIATEDVRFYEHSGVDLKALFSIPWYILRGENRGGSTITQQLAKNLFNTRDSSSQGLLADVPGFKMLIYKTKEWITAVNLEKSYTKEEILTMYFNTVEFGNNTAGIRTAAKFFFSSSPDSLSLEEAALLVGVLKAPTTYNPTKRPENALRRRNVVLNQMTKYNFLTKAEYNRYVAIPIKLNIYNEPTLEATGTYYTSAMTSYLRKWCKENGYDLYSDGLRIYTTIDSRIQQHAEDAMQEHMRPLQKKFFAHWRGMNPWRDSKGQEIPNYLENAIQKTDYYKYLLKKYKKTPDSIQAILNRPHAMRVFTWLGERDTMLSTMDSLRYYKHFMQASLMSMDPHNGHIKAWVGGIEHKFFKYDHVKQSRRQPGSTFKPFVYAAAIDSMGYTPCSRLQDSYTTIRYTENGEEKVWNPHNADWNFTGMNMTLRHAMGRSINTVTARLTELVGWNTVARYAQKMGISSKLAIVPSIGLGSSEVTLYEMVGAYGTFVNEGFWTEPTFITQITNRDGRIIKKFTSKRKKALTEESAWLMLYMLKGSVQEPMGTSGRLYSYRLLGNNNDVGGKTGTSSNHADAWFMGVTKDLVTGVWVGGDDNSIHFRTSDLGEGSKAALPIFGLFMEKIYEDPTLGITKGPFPECQVEIKKPYYCPTYYPKTDSLSADSTALIGVVDAP
ncbi:MAG: penicillin-binding protein [Cytophagales bacterium]|nr:MAG: penicillin-binding protein [Cytophagales bacterium]TAF61913.1 MAG: penicillin-binding protein [Cytophagales bacterium]